MTDTEFQPLFYVLAALGLMMTIVMIVVRQGYAFAVHGMGLWATGQLMASLGVMALAARGAWMEFGGSVLLVLGNILLYFSLQQYFAVRRSYRRWLAGFLLTLPIMAWFSFVAPADPVRGYLYWTAAAAMMLSMAWLIWRQGGVAFANQLLAWMLMLTGLVFLSRLLAFGEQSAVAQTDVLVLGYYPLMLLALSLGFLLMASAKMHEALAYVATHDALTRVLLRSALLAACEQELARSRRHAHSMVLLLLDIDQFKALTEAHGFEVGDRVLVEFANRVRPLLRRSDQLGRYGADSFLVLLPETTPEKAQVVVDRIRGQVELPAPGLPAIKVRIGVAANRPDESDLQLLLARAEQARYLVQDQGERVVEA